MTHLADAGAIGDDGHPCLLENLPDGKGMLLPRKREAKVPVLHIYCRSLPC